MFKSNDEAAVKYFNAIAGAKQIGIFDVIYKHIEDVPTWINLETCETVTEATLEGSDHA